jgi:hypothetical protein
VPPGPLELALEVGGSVNGDSIGLSPVPDGYGGSVVGSCFVNIAGTVVGGASGPLSTELQGMYIYRNAGTGTYTVTLQGYRWAS